MKAVVVQKESEQAYLSSVRRFAGIASAAICLTKPYRRQQYPVGFRVTDRRF